MTPTLLDKILIMLMPIGVLVVGTIIIYYFGPGRPQTCKCGEKVYGFPTHCPKCGAPLKISF